MSYTIVIEELTFKSILGILKEERDTPQLIIVDAKIEYEEKFIDYMQVSTLIEKIIKDGKFRLVEEAIDKITYELKNKYPQIKSIYLKIKKPEILNNALVGIEVLRKY